jgi:CRP-like cAMP-binding protein
MTEQTKLLNILKRTDIFYGLDDTQLDRIAEICSEVTLENNEVIFEENSVGDEMYIIVGGKVDILIDPALVRPTSTDEPLTITTFERGQTFGEIALVDEGRRSASARCAAEEVQLLVIPRDRLIDLCDKYPTLGYRLMRNIATDLAFKIRGTDFRIREPLLWKARET